MKTQLNKLTLLSVGVAGLGLLACGPANKEGDPKPVDATTVRQAIVGNTKAIAADVSRNAQFLEASTLLKDGLGLTTYAEVSVCGSTPDGGTSCETEPEPAPTELDFDINDETDELVADLERRILADSNVEASEEFAITYLVSGALACAVEGEPLDQDCVDSVDAAEIRLVITSPAEGDVDVDVLVGPDRVNPVSLQIHADLLAIEADLGGIKDSAQHLGGITGETLELPATFEGRLRFEVSAPSDTKVGAAISVLQAVKVADGDFSFSVGQSLPLYALTLDSAAKTLLGESNVGAVDGSFPTTSYSYDSATGVETETTRQYGFHIGGVTGTTLLDAAAELLTLTGVGLGPDSTTVSVDGATVATVDLNADAGRMFNATISADSDDSVRIEVDPEFDLRVALQLANLADAADEYDAWMMDEVLRVTLDSAAKPVLRILEGGMEVVEGKLTMSLQNAAITHTVDAGQCVLSESDAPLAEPNPDGDGEPMPIEEGDGNPLEGMTVGACQ